MVKLVKDDIMIVINLVESWLFCGSEVIFDKLWDEVNGWNLWLSKVFFLVKYDE